MGGGRPEGPPLGDQIVQDGAGDIGQAEIAPAISVSQLSVLDPKKVQDCGVDIVDMHRLFDGFESEIVGSSIDRATFDRAARQPHGEPERVMVAAAFDGPTRTADLADWSASEL